MNELTRIDSNTNGKKSIAARKWQGNWCKRLQRNWCEFLCSSYSKSTMTGTQYTYTAWFMHVECILCSWCYNHNNNNQLMLWAENPIGWRNSLKISSVRVVFIPIFLLDMLDGENCLRTYAYMCKCNWNAIMCLDTSMWMQHTIAVFVPRRYLKHTKIV